MKKYQLKQLIKEVLHEVEGMSASTSGGSSDNNKEKPEDDDNTMKHSIKHSTEHENEYKTIATLELRGVLRGNAHALKRFLAKAAHAAAMEDLKLIHADIERDGKKIIDMKSDELKSIISRAQMPGDDEEGEDDDENARQADIETLKGRGLNIKSGIPQKAQAPAPIQQKGTFDQQVNPANFTPDEKAEWDDQKTKPARRRELVRLSKIKPGEKEEDWKAATAQDDRNRLEKERLKKAAKASGTYNPKDSKLWTDKQWDAFGHDMESGKSKEEAIHRAVLVDDPTNKKYWSGIEYSVYNDARQKGKPENLAMNSVIRNSAWNDDQRQKYRAAISQGRTEQEAMEIGDKYQPKFKDIGATKMKMPNINIGPLREYARKKYRRFS